MARPLLVRPVNDGRDLELIFADPVGTRESPVRVVGRLPEPIEVLDPATSKPRTKVDSASGEVVPDPLTTDARTMGVAGVLSFELPADVVEVLIDGESVWTADAPQ